MTKPDAGPAIGKTAMSFMSGQYQEPGDTRPIKPVIQDFGTGDRNVRKQLVACARLVIVRQKVKKVVHLLNRLCQSRDTNASYSYIFHLDLRHPEIAP